MLYLSPERPLSLLCLVYTRHTDDRSDMIHGTKATDLKCSSIDKKKRILNPKHIIFSNVNFYKVFFNHLNLVSPI